MHTTAHSPRTRPRTTRHGRTTPPPATPHRWLALLLLTALLMLAMALAAPLAAAAPPLPPLPADIGESAHTYVDALSRITNPDGTYTGLLRVAGTEGEYEAALKVAGWFTEAGYLPVLQPFNYKRDGVAYASQNVVAWRPADVKGAKKKSAAARPLVIVGAHYDAVKAGQGADDNASGVGVMLEVAERVADLRLPYDLVFVAFGAEEVGLIGSNRYSRSLPKADKDRAIVMINLDSVLVGDKLYVYSGTNGWTWARTVMLELAALRGLPIETQMGLNHKYPAGTTPNGFSDYTAFNQIDIPIAAFESTNWEIGELDGYTQTEEYGSFWHTPWDTLEMIEFLYPERPMERLSAFTTVIHDFLTTLDPKTIDVTESIELEPAVPETAAL
ncbi:MAG: M20/M25/M40 family metallo-hydrolase [Thermoleophilia bacterium]|nr:M20/M25/M40 family metallo-hydrolase [Thermoleophilia bacterium]